MTPEIAKKQVCMMVLIWPRMPGRAGDLVGVDDVEAQALVSDLRLHFARQVLPDLAPARTGC